MVEVKQLNEETTLLQCNSCGCKENLKQIIVKYGAGNGAGGQSIVLCDFCKKALKALL